MVQAPARLTLAAQLVRRLWSRSVAVMVRRPVSPSEVASKRKFERIGIVVLRSTTDWAAESSRRSSARDTLISRLPVGAGLAAVMGVSGSSVRVKVGLQSVPISGQQREEPAPHKGSDSLILGSGSDFVRQKWRI